MEGRRLVVLCAAVSVFASVVANLFVWALLVAPLLGTDSQYRQMIDRERGEIASQRKEFADWMREEFARQDRAALARFDDQLAASEQRIAERIDNTMKRIERDAQSLQRTDPAEPSRTRDVASEASAIPMGE